MSSKIEKAYPAVLQTATKIANCILHILVTDIEIEIYIKAELAQHCTHVICIVSRIPELPFSIRTVPYNQSIPDLHRTRGLSCLYRSNTSIWLTQDRPS